MPHGETETLWKVIDRLEKGDIPYMLTGSMALNFYGQMRATRDIDIVVQIRSEDVETLYQLFKTDFYIDQESVRSAVKNRSMFNIIDNASIFKVDFIMLGNDSLSRLQFSRRKTIALGNQHLTVISPEDLILAKLAWAKQSLSELQHRDIENLLHSNQDTLDFGYITQWAEKVGLLENFKDIYASFSRHQS